MTGNVDPRISVSLVCARGWPIESACRVVAARGVSRVSATLTHLADTAQGRRDFGDALHANGLALASIGTGGRDLIGGQGLAEWLDPLLDAANAFSCREVFTVSGPAGRRVPTDVAFDRLVAALGPAVDAAAARDVRLSIEHSSPATRALGFVHSLADACSLAEATGCGIVVELQNCWYERRLPELFSSHAHRIALVQVSDFTVGEELRLNRKVPGDGDIPLEWLIGELLAAGYKGGFELEFLGPTIEAEGCGQAIARGVDWLCGRLSRLGR